MLNCFVKKLFGLLFMAICYLSVDLGYKLEMSTAQLALPLLSFFCSVPRSGVKRLPRSGGVPRKIYFYS